MKYQIFIAVFAPIFASYYGKIPSAQGAFQCDDPSIRHKYTGDSVPTKLLFQMVLLPIIFIVFFTELNVLQRQLKKSFLTAIKQSSLTTLYVYFSYWVGQSVNTIVNISLKCMASTPRPHFLDTCQPDWNKIDCTRTVLFDSSICTTDKSTEASLLRLNDSMKSFPSGHAQIAMFASAFTYVYLSKRPSSFPRYLIQLLALLLGLLCGYSRLEDHRHHFVDVFTGGSVGTILGIIWALKLDVKTE